jgi:hypothetical protein
MAGKLLRTHAPTHHTHTTHTHTHTHTHNHTHTHTHTHTHPLTLTLTQPPHTTPHHTTPHHTTPHHTTPHTDTQNLHAFRICDYGKHLRTLIRGWKPTARWSVEVPILLIVPCLATIRSRTFCLLVCCQKT